MAAAKSTSKPPSRTPRRARSRRHAQPAWSVTTELLEAYLQCPKRAWLEVHKPQMRKEAEDAAYWQRQGEAVHKAAERQFLGGFRVMGGEDSALAHTRELLQRHKRPTLLSAALRSGRLYVRPDVWEVRSAGFVTEVTASTAEGGRLKKDKARRVAARLALTAYVMKKCGHKTGTLQVQAIDSESVWSGQDPTYDDILRKVDINGSVKEFSRTLPSTLSKIRVVVEGPMPRVRMTRHCKKPFPCPFSEHCRGSMRKGARRARSSGLLLSERLVRRRHALAALACGTRGACASKRQGLSQP